MSRELTAFFDTDEKHLKHLIERMEQVTGEKCPVTLEPFKISADRTGTAAFGPAQQVMFVIGHVANEGEDFLIKVA